MQKNIFLCEAELLSLIRSIKEEQPDDNEFIDSSVEKIWRNTAYCPVGTQSLERRIMLAHLQRDLDKRTREHNITEAIRMRLLPEEKSNEYDRH